MPNKPQRPIQYRLYEGWSKDLLKAELSTLSAINCGFWLETVAALLRSDTGGGVKFASERTGEIYLNDATSHQRLATRLFRYLSSEQLFYLLFSAHDDSPYARVTRTIRPDELATAYEAIANMKVPEKHERINGHALSFNAWLPVKMGDWNATELCPTLYKFIANEAEFLRERTFINALKHGRAQTNPTVEALAMSVEINGIWVPVLPAEKMIFVETWSEKRSVETSVFEHTTHAEGFNLQEEIGALNVSFHVMKAILDTRIAYLEMMVGIRDDCNINFYLPNQILSSRRVTRYMNLPLRDPARPL